MMGATAVVDQIRRSIEILGESSDPSGSAVAAALHRMLECNRTFEIAVGLAPGWRSCVRQAKSQSAITAIARYYPGLSGRPQARAILEDAQRYEGGQWSHDREAGRRPDRLQGFFFDLLSLGKFPCEETVRKTLGYCGQV